MGYIIERTGSFNDALIFVVITALLATVAYLPLVGEIKRVDLKLQNRQVVTRDRTTGNPRLSPNQDDACDSSRGARQYIAEPRQSSRAILHAKPRGCYRQCRKYWCWRSS